MRTAKSLTSFGFTIYKFFEELSKSPQAPARILTPRIVGMLMIFFGFIGLLVAQVQHHIALKKLRQNCPGMQPSLSSVQAILILVYGLILFVGALFRQ